MKASVVICTYNRSGLLRESILSVQRQDFPAGQFQIVVVDNNSTDGTEGVVKDLAASSGVEIKYVFEGRQGHSHARNKGVASADAGIIVFTDDDVEAEPSWLREILAVFEDPDVACAGGPIRPVWPAEKPDWLSGRWLDYLAVSEFESVREKGEFDGVNEFPWGANIAFRKDVFEYTGLFLTSLGRVGKDVLMSSDEILPCIRMKALGKRIAFAPNALIHHKIAPERMTKLWFYHRTYWQGRSDAILDMSHGRNAYAKVRKYMSELVWRECVEKGDDFEKRCLYRTVQGYIHEVLFAPGEGGRDGRRRIRTLEAALSGALGSAAVLIGERADKVDELVKYIDEKHRDLEEYGRLTAEKDEFIREQDKQITARDEELRPYRELGNTLIGRLFFRMFLGSRPPSQM